MTFYTVKNVDFIIVITNYKKNKKNENIIYNTYTLKVTLTLKKTAHTLHNILPNVAVKWICTELMMLFSFKITENEQAIILKSHSKSRLKQAK